MGRTGDNRRLILAMAAAVVLVVGGVLWAYPVVGADSFALTAGNSEVIRTGSAADLGVRVSATTGHVAVEHNTGTWVHLGDVLAGQAAVFEGTYADVRVRAVGGNAAGTYELRDLTASSPAEGIIGSGECSVSSTPVRVFSAGVSAYRRITIVAGTGDVSLRTSSGGQDVISIDAGDSACCDFTTDGFWILGSGTIQFDVKAVDPPPQNPWSEGDCEAGSADDFDDVSTGDGTVCVEIVIENKGKGDVTIDWQKDGQGQPARTIEPGDSQSFDCHIENLRVRYTHKDGKVHWKKRKFQ